MLGKEFKSSSCCLIGGCLQVRIIGQKVEIRKTKGREKTLRCSIGSWQDSIKGVKDGEFDV